MAVTTTTTTTTVPSAPSAGNIPKDYSPSTRVEAIPRPDFPHAKYPRWIGHKFTPSGEVLPFPGNTVLCHLSMSSPLHQLLTSLHEELQKQPFAPSLALLPPASYHMTFYEGVSYHIPVRELWPDALPLDCSLQTCHDHLTSVLSDLKLDTAKAPPYRLCIEGFEELTDGIALKLAPATPDEDKRMRQLRDDMADKVGLRHPGFETYVFHLSMAYLLKWQSAEEKQEMQSFLDQWLKGAPREFELGRPEVCVYQGMTEFRRVCYLGESHRP